jgi:hypothetical protein
MAVATAWLSAITGLSEASRSSSYNARICGQSVVSALAASSCTAAIAACSWNGTGWWRRSVAVISATPSLMAAGPSGCGPARGSRIASAHRSGRCPACGQTIRDRRPVILPAADEAGHANGCGRLAAAMADWQVADRRATR